MRVEGEPMGEGEWLVKEIVVLSPKEAGKRPYYYDHPPEFVLGAGELRRIVHTFMAQRGYVEIMLPSTWHSAQECEDEEIEVRTPGGGSGMVLLQSPQMPAYVALAGGLDKWYSFARSWRFAKGDADCREAGRLFEFEQLVLGGVGVDVGELTVLCEDLFSALSASQGIVVDRQAFRRVEVQGARRSDVLSFEPVSVLKLTPAFGTAVRRLLWQRLQALRAEVVILDSAGQSRYGLDAIMDSDSERVVAQVEESRSEEVAALFDLVRRSTNSDNEAAIADGIVSTWMPTWRLLPARDGMAEDRPSGTDAPLPAASLSGRLRTAGAASGCTEALLSIGGADIAHVEELAPFQQFYENVKQRGIPLSRYEYLTALLEHAAEPMTVASLGWEQLAATLLGTVPTRTQLLPRWVDGSAASAQTPSLYA